MAQVQTAVDAFISQIEEIETNFNKKLSVAVNNLSKLSETELINATAQLNLFNEIIQEGYGEALNRLDGEYAKLLDEAIKLGASKGLTPLGGAGFQGLEVLRDLNTETLLGRARDYSNLLTTQLFQNLYAGVPVNQIIAGLETIPLATHQLNVATYTGIKTFDDSARYQVFKGQKVKWTYLGPLDNRTRDKCRETIENEPPGGYTEKQINSRLVDTKFGTRGGFNCRPSWEVK